MFNFGRKKNKKVRGTSPDFSAYEGKIPHHVAIIMDGNGRWAKLKGQPRSYGHKVGSKNVARIVKHAFSRGVKAVSLYAFSSENWSRPKEEIDGLFELFRGYYNEYRDKVREREEKIRFRALGDISLLPEDIQNILREAEEKTAGFIGRSVNVAVCYGGRDEIVRAVNEAVKKGENVTEESFSRLLYTAEVPDPDLIIRTGKEKRLSNFLLYQAAYAELYFSSKMFPEFTNREFDKAIADYQTRTRRFGKTDEQVVEKSYKNP